jgi:hypothetical protein
MNLRDALLKEHSKANKLSIVEWIADDTGRFRALLQLFLHDEYRVVQSAAGCLSIVAERHPELVTPHLTAMVQRLQERGLPDAVRRNILRILQHVPLPEALHGQLMNSCFNLLEDPKEPIAVRAFGMTVLGRLAKTYPDLKVELRAIIEAALQQQPSPGFKSRAGKVLKMIA